MVTGWRGACDRFLSIRPGDADGNGRRLKTCGYERQRQLINDTLVTTQWNQCVCVDADGNGRRLKTCGYERRC